MSFFSSAPSGVGLGPAGLSLKISGWPGHVNERGCATKCVLKQ